MFQVTNIVQLLCISTIIPRQRSANLNFVLINLIQTQSRVGEAGLLGDTLSRTKSSKADAIAAVAWMQAIKDAGIADAWVVPAHVERAHSYFIDDFRNWQDAGPDVAFGFEGAPWSPDIR